MKKKSPANRTAVIIVTVIFFILMFFGENLAYGIILLIPCIAFLIIVKFATMLKEKISSSATPIDPAPTTNFVDNLVKCPKCNASVKAGAKFCGSCGAPIPEKKYVTVADYAPILKFSESILLDEFIARELGKAQIDPNT